MDILSLDLYSYIIKFFSFKEKVLYREINKNFNINIKKKYLIYHRLENNLNRIFGKEEIKNLLNLQCFYSNSKENFYHEKIPENIHSHFKKGKPAKKCIDVNCNKNLLGQIYILEKENKKKEEKLIKRCIPYCVMCYMCKMC